jgi:hypothetical protein
VVEDWWQDRLRLGSIPCAAHEEMADMVGCGMTAAQVIVAATRNRLI